MASLTHHLFSFFILSSLVFMFISPCQCVTHAQAPKVELALYYESLCPGCADFIVNYLPKLFETDVKYITKVNLIPWGNAKLQPNKTVICQHGEDECYFNTIEACALYLWPNIEISFPFIKCVEEKLAEANLKSSTKEEQIWKTCTQEMKLDQKLVKHCYDSGLGQQLILMNANKTKTHEFVPWVLIDGNPLGAHYDKFIKYICEAYTGQPKPHGCRPKATKFTSISKEKTQPVCYGDEGLERTETNKLLEIDESNLTPPPKRGV